MLDNYYLVKNSQMPGENLMVGPLHADSLEQCANLCERNNAVLKGGYANDGAISTGYSFQHCNGFVYDVEKKQCILKNKRMGNFDPEMDSLIPKCAFYNPSEGNARFISGYKWENYVNEINSPFPNRDSGMQTSCANPAWSTNTWGQQSGNIVYNVNPGAIISPKNVTTGPYSSSTFPHVVERCHVRNMQECADIAAKYANSQGGPYTGSNAWTFHPNYANQSNQKSASSVGGTRGIDGTCSIGHVREPYYQTLTGRDNGAISGFAVSSESREIQRFNY